jgi:hypothetical protein
VDPVEERAHLVPGERRRGEAGRGEQDGDSGAGRDPSRLDLGDHAAGPDAGLTGLPDRDPGQVGLAPHGRDPGRGRARGIPGVESVHIGEKYQQVRVQQRGHERGETVVVAEPDLLGGDGVVLVDDRDRTQREQAVQRPVRVAVVGAPDHVIDREQDLTDRTVMAREGLGVGPHE